MKQTQGNPPVSMILTNCQVTNTNMMARRASRTHQKEIDGNDRKAGAQGSCFINGTEYQYAMPTLTLPHNAHEY
jgi:hypothetical protein